jgi:hypothetical protein
MKLDRRRIEKCTAAEADAASGSKGWADRTPRELLEALESLRLLRIQRLPDGSLPRLERVVSIVRRREH